ncbi:hypothetical protein BD779DRAFT_1477699 [Infundibulicybe gibba]|nr:hypothetical protein BD779DRAFT_1477699 [Infundibulicybe gibba]
MAPDRYACPPSGCHRVSVNAPSKLGTQSNSKRERSQFLLSPSPNSPGDKLARCSRSIAWPCARSLARVDSDGKFGRMHVGGRRRVLDKGREGPVASTCGRSQTGSFTRQGDLILDARRWIEGEALALSIEAAAKKGATSVAGNSHEGRQLFGLIFFYGQPVRSIQQRGGICGWDQLGLKLVQRLAPRGVHGGTCGRAMASNFNAALEGVVPAGGGGRDGGPAVGPSCSKGCALGWRGVFSGGGELDGVGRGGRHRPCRGACVACWGRAPGLSDRNGGSGKKECLRYGPFLLLAVAGGGDGAAEAARMGGIKPLGRLKGCSSSFSDRADDAGQRRGGGACSKSTLGGRAMGER